MLYIWLHTHDYVWITTWMSCFISMYIEPCKVRTHRNRDFSKDKLVFKRTSPSARTYHKYEIYVMHICMNPEEIALQKDFLQLGLCWFHPARIFPFLCRSFLFLVTSCMQNIFTFYIAPWDWQCHAVVAKCMKRIHMEYGVFICMNITDRSQVNLKVSQ